MQDVGDRHGTAPLLKQTGLGEMGMGARLPKQVTECSESTGSAISRGRW
jgi:hypothetical protein